MPERDDSADQPQNAPETRYRRLPRPTQAQLDARRAYRRAIKRSRNPFRFSLRSLAFTLLLAVMTAALMFSLVMALRGAPPAPALEPVIEVEPAPIRLDGEESAGPAGALSNTPDASVQTILAVETPVNPALTGPPIPTVLITNTPVPLRVGLRAAVHGVGNDKLNVRNIPSLVDSKVLFRAAPGAEFDIIGGPQEADGFTWWQLYDTEFQVQGWAVAIYLQALPDQTG